jgi:hypothetical protein
MVFIFDAITENAKANTTVSDTSPTCNVPNTNNMWFSPNNAGGYRVAQCNGANWIPSFSKVQEYFENNATVLSFNNNVGYKQLSDGNISYNVNINSNWRRVKK